MLLRLAYLGVTNTFAMLRLLPMSNRDKDVHRTALLASLGVTDGRDSEVQAPLADVIAAPSALEVQRIVYAAGWLAVAARSKQRVKPARRGRRRSWAWCRSAVA